ncbi:MAG TPA: hypothetical protein PLN21_20050 [Gemmatales bacterium]|nr:hypothetical protein [Gemmatales bacterium]
MLTSLTPFERKVLDSYIVVANESETLRKQVATVTVVSRENTGHGTFTQFEADTSCKALFPATGEVSTTKMVLLEHPALPDGACTVLFVKDGYIEMLECAVFGNEEWPEDETLFTICLEDRASK